MHENFLKFHIETLNVLGFNILLIARTTFSNKSFIRIMLNKDAHLCVSKHNLFTTIHFCWSFLISVLENRNLNKYFKTILSNV